MVNLLKTPGATLLPDGDARFFFPRRRIEVAYTDLGSGATDTIAFDPLPTFSIPLFAGAQVTTAWTVGGGNTTGLTLQIGDAVDPDELRAAGNLVGLSAGHIAVATMANGANHFVPDIEIAAYAPELLFTATGGDTELDHVDAGALTACVWFIAIPEDL